MEILDGQEENFSKSLREAEALADQYKDVKPQPFVIPMERLAGIPSIFNKNDI